MSSAASEVALHWRQEYSLLLDPFEMEALYWAIAMNEVRTPQWNFEAISFKIQRSRKRLYKANSGNKSKTF